MGNCIRKEPCPSCGSRDNLGRYDDGGAYCFGCRYREPPTRGNITIEEQPTEQKDWTPIEVTYAPMPSRGFSKEDCEANDYGWGEYNGEKCHVANVRDARGKLIGQKLRMNGKKFLRLGQSKDNGLWLMHKFGGGGKHIIITEGECDAIAMRKAQDHKWPVVSLPDGSKSAARAIAHDYEELNKFDRIVLMFDMDGPGQAAAEEAAALLPPGKVAIASLQHKDANDVLKLEGPGALIKAFWNARDWRPDGIRHVSDFKEEFLNPPAVRGIEYPWPLWNDVLGKMRLGALVTLTAGTGIGKSTLMRELLFHALVHAKEPCAGMFLEESGVETLEALVSIAIEKNIAMDRKLATPEATLLGYELLEKMPLYLYDHFGSSDVDNICAKIRYLAKACGVRWVFLDHISILVSGLDGDERRTIDMAMTKLATLVSELKIGLFCIVHLKRPQGDQGHEDGAEVHLGQLRGSHSIAQLSHVVVGLNKPPEDTMGYGLLPVCIKNRHNGGKKGSMGKMIYNPETGRVKPDESTPFDDAVEAEEQTL